MSHVPSASVPQTNSLLAVLQNVLRGSRTHGFAAAQLLLITLSVPSNEISWLDDSATQRGACNALGKKLPSFNENSIASALKVT